MPDKKIVDDYYSSMNSSEDSKDSSASSKKPIIKAKKIIIKKPSVKAPEEKPVINKEISAKNTEKPVEKAVEKPKPKFTVVRRDDKNHSSNRPANKSTDSKPANKPRFKIVTRAELEKRKIEAWEASASKKEKPKQTFKNATPTSNNENHNSQSDDRSKKYRWAHHKTRGRFKYVEEEKDNTFTRSNKVNKQKKEEKKVEDIKQNLTVRTWETVVLPELLSLKELSEKIWVALPQLMAEFMKNGMMVNINSQIDYDSASIVAEAFEIKAEKDTSGGVNVEDVMTWDLSKFLAEDDAVKLSPRSPVISIMWHVDHWKTSLLDHIRKSKVTDWEAWGITQSIWAYQVETEKWKITFLDTPGHEAFTIMRARWAKSTDIAILVVAADEWVKPQTIESINHAKEAEIPVIVAINKMDKEGANPDNVKGQLAEHGLTPEDWGGDTPMVPVSAMTWFWIDDLLEIILLVAEMKELKANPNRNGVATVVESHLDQKLWPVATVLVNTWTVSHGDYIVCEDSFWKIKILKDYKWKNAKTAIPGDPVLIVWLDKVVEWWNILQVVQSAEVAREKSIEYKSILDSKKRDKMSSLDVLMWKIKAWNLKQLKIILKADTNWSLEAIRNSLVKLSTPETTVSVIHSWVWSITEGDILMSEWSDAILVGFSVWVLSTAKGVLDASWIEYIHSDIIYHITERVEKIVTWMLDPKEVETTLCVAKVGGIFYTSKEFMILWLKLGEDSKIENNALVRVIRKQKVVGTWKIKSLKQWIEEVKNLEGPIECWIKYVWKGEVLEHDELEVYKIEIHK